MVSENVYVFVPKNLELQEAWEYWQLNCIVGGLIVVLLFLWRIIVIFTEIIKVIAGHSLDTMSKGVKEKRATKKALSINHKQYLYLSSGTPAWFRSISVTSQNGISCFARLPSFL